MSPLVHWDLWLGPSLASSPVTFRPPVHLCTEGGGLEEPAVLPRYIFPPTHHREQEEPFSGRGKPATPYVNELIVFSTNPREEGSLKITNLSSERFPKMLKRYPPFQGHHLLWSLLKFTRSECWCLEELVREEASWVGGGSGNGNRTADTLHKRLSHDCQLQELFLLGPELSFLFSWIG